MNGNTLSLNLRIATDAQQTHAEAARVEADLTRVGAAGSAAGAQASAGLDRISQSLTAAARDAAPVSSTIARLGSDASWAGDALSRLGAQGSAALAAMEQRTRAAAAAQAALAQQAGTAAAPVSSTMARLGSDASRAGDALSRLGVQGSAALAAMEQRARSAAAAQAALVQQAGAAAAAQAATWARLGSDASRAGDALSRMGAQGSAALAAMEQRTGAAAAGVTRVDRAAASAGGSLLAMAGSVVAIAALTAGLHAAVDAMVRLDKTAKALESISGSSITAAQDFSYIQEVSERLGVSLSGAAGGFVKLTAAAQGTSLQGDATRRVFESVAKAGAALGLSTDEVNGALTAISQMMSKGTVASEELRGQLGERLPGAFQVAARAMGVTTAELSKMLEQGQVIADDFLPKFAAELDTTYSNARFDGIQNGINRMTTAWEQFKASVLDSDLVKSTLDSVTLAINAALDAKAVDRVTGSRQALQVELDAKLAAGPQSLGGGTDVIAQSLFDADVARMREAIKHATDTTEQELADAHDALVREVARYAGEPLEGALKQRLRVIDAMQAQLDQRTADFAAGTDMFKGSAFMASAGLGLSGAAEAALPTLDNLQAATQRGMPSTKEQTALDKSSATLAIALARQAKDMGALTEAYTAQIKVEHGYSDAVARSLAQDKVREEQLQSSAKAFAGAKNDAAETLAARLAAVKNGLQLESQTLAQARDLALLKAGEDAAARLKIEKDYQDKKLAIERQALEQERTLLQAAAARETDQGKLAQTSQRLADLQARLAQNAASSQFQGEKSAIEQPRADAAAQMELLQRKLAAVQQQEQRIQVLSQTGAITEFQAQEQLHTLHEQAAADLEAIVQKLETLAQTSGLESLRSQAMGARTELLRLKDSGFTWMKNLEGSAVSSLADNLTAVATGAKTAGDAMQSFALDVVAALAKIAAQKAAESLLSGIFNMVGTAVGAMGGTSTAFAPDGSMLSRTMTYGNGASSTFFPKAPMARAPKTRGQEPRHLAALAEFGAGPLPEMYRHGPGVVWSRFTGEQTAPSVAGATARDGAGQPVTVNVPVTINGASDGGARPSLSQSQADLAGKQLKGVVQQEILRMMQPGGPLAARRPT